MLKQQTPYHPQPFQQHNWLRLFSTLLPFFGAVLYSLLAPSSAHALTSGVTITSITPFAALDSNNSCLQGPRAMYLQVNVTNTTSGTLTGLSANINSFSNSSFTLDSGESATRYIGSLAAGQTTSLYWYVNYPCTSNSTFPTTNYTVTLSDSTPGTVTSSTFTLTTRSEISASAGGNIVSALIGAGAVPGQIIPYTVNYDFGNPSRNAEVMIQPAGNVTFDSSCFRLIGTDITSSTNFTAGPLTSNDNRLYFTGVAGGSSNQLTVAYSFMSLCNSAGTVAKPFASQTSGGPQKYTGNYETYISPAFPVSTNPFVITKSASSATLPTGGTITYTVTVSNPSSYNAIIDRITDILPPNVTYGSLVTGTGNTSTTIVTGSTSQPIAGATGTINWLGNPNTSYSLPARGSLTLKYTANVPNVVGSYTNSATTTAGSSTTAPVTATVSVGISDLTLTKTHTGNFTVGSPASYTLTVNNIGTAPSTGTVTVTDTLPTGLTIPNGTVTLIGANAANWSCLAASNVITCNSTTAIATGGNSTFNLTGIQVGAAATPSVTNNAVVAGGSEVNVSNNTATDLTNVTVPPTIDLDGNDSSGANANDFNTSYTLGGSAIKIVDANNSTETLDTVITDTDSTQLSKAVITLTNNPAIVGDALSINATALSVIAAGAITADTSVPNQITLNGNANLADYEAALELIEFSTTATNTTTRTVTVRVTDTSNQASNTATTNISIQVPSVIDLDYGDAPDTGTGTGTDNYQTTANDGGAAQVVINAVGQVLSLGNNIDVDDGSLQNNTALADDNNGTTDDEDGVSSFPTLTTTANQTYTVPVSVQNNVPLVNAYLAGYIDFNKDGDFLDAGEKSATVTIPRTFNVTFTTPTGMTPGNTYARFRLGQVQATVESATGASANTDNGEVEDYQIAIATKRNPDVPPDFCQLPSRNFLFILDDSSSVDPAEIIQQKNAVMATLNSFVAKNLTGKAAIVGFDANGRTVIDYTDITANNLGAFKTALDDTTKYGLPYSGTNWEAGFQAGINLGVNQPDIVFFFTDGTQTGGGSPSEDEATQFKNAGAHIYGIGIDGLTIDSGFKPITDGDNSVIYNVNGSNIFEADYVDIDSYDSLQSQYTNNFLANLCPADFGDAPDSYGTDNISNTSTGNPIGANHTIVSGLYLGATPPDRESNGFVDGTDNSNGNATDDDAAVGTGTGNGNDEGNFTFPTLNAGKKGYRIPASNITVTNTTGNAATLHAWIDFDKNGKFDSTEHRSVSVPQGTNAGNPTANLTWSGINVGTVGDTYARFRLTSDSSIDNTTPGGAANSGEVEDYKVAIATASDPKLLLVKRITAINPGKPDEVRFNTFVDDLNDPNDDVANWPTNKNTYLPGRINVTDVKPGDEVEYTIYFLSNGDIDAQNVKICDVVPDNMTFNKHSYGTEVGISLALDATNLPTTPNIPLSNVIGDKVSVNDPLGSFYPPGTNPPVLDLCQKHNPNPPYTLTPLQSSNNLSGAVLIELTNPLPKATGAGTPFNSYGFIRFRAKVK
jgi:uncharacterized repeat protein (TIGR01451 family)